MTEETIDPMIAQQLQQGLAEDEPKAESWTERHWFLLLGGTLAFLWACLIWLLSLIPHHPH